MTMNRHEPYEELISASLTGDLTDDERQRLDAHLDGCAQCRATLAAFADQRRIVAGLRHLAPPRDLGARVRTGIETGALSHVPWWRRPAAIFAGVGGGLAVVAGALLALVILNGPNNEPPVAVSPSSTAESVAASPTVSAEPEATPIASVSAAPSATIAPTPTATPVPASPEPDVFLAFTGPLESPTLTVRDGTTGEEIVTADTPGGPPIAAALSPDEQWLAYITQLGASGLNEVRATRIAEATPSDDPDAPEPVDSPIAVGETVVLGESVAGSPFLEHLFWSSNSNYLAFTLAGQKEDSTDVWIFRPGVGEPERVTDVGNAVAGSWVPGGAGTSQLWVSTAAETPESYLLTFHASSGSIQAGDPADSPFPPAENIFQPMVSANGELVIFWAGQMEQAGADWLFSQGGQPWLAENTGDGQGGYEFTDAAELFSDLSVGRDGFSSAAIGWSGDSDSFAVWNARWTGISQSPDEQYPNPDRVYFGHASDARLLTRTHAIDTVDIPGNTFVVDVEVAATGRHLRITTGHPRAGVLDPPRADLLLVTRNTGSTADEVQVLGDGDEGWFGPAASSR